MKISSLPMTAFVALVWTKASTGAVVTNDTQPCSVSQGPCGDDCWKLQGSVDSNGSRNCEKVGPGSNSPSLDNDRDAFERASSYFEAADYPVPSSPRAAMETVTNRALDREKPVALPAARKVKQAHMTPSPSSAPSMAPMSLLVLPASYPSTETNFPTVWSDRISEGLLHWSLPSIPTSVPADADTNVEENGDNDGDQGSSSKSLFEYGYPYMLLAVAVILVVPFSMYCFRRLRSNRLCFRKEEESEVLKMLKYGIPPRPAPGQAVITDDSGSTGGLEDVDLSTDDDHFNKMERATSQVDAVDQNSVCASTKAKA